MSISAVNKKEHIETPKKTAKSNTAHVDKAKHPNCVFKGHELKNNKTKHAPQVSSQEKAAEIKKHYKNDLKSGVLEKQSSIHFFGIKLRDEKFIFNVEKYKEKTGKNITFGDVAKRYGIPQGVLKENNDLKFYGGDADNERGYNLNHYTANEFGLDKLKFPSSAVKGKY